MLLWPAFVMSAIGLEPEAASLVRAVCRRSWKGRTYFEEHAYEGFGRRERAVDRLRLGAVGPLSRETASEL